MASGCYRGGCGEGGRLMPMLRNVLGLDLGAHSFKAVEIQQTLRSFEAVQLRSILRTDPDLPVDELLLDFVQHHGFNRDYVVMAFPGDRLSTHELSFPFRERRKLGRSSPGDDQQARLRPASTPHLARDLEDERQRLMGKAEPFGFRAERHGIFGR